ncbi:MAG: hypothetical protein NVSMB15_02790 [Steroidobacteraceae bacterium]
MHGKLISMAFAFTAFACVAMAQSPAPDWRMYGITPTEDRVALFYLYNKIVRSPPGHVQVWVKALDYGALNKFTDHASDDVVAKAIAKASKAYVPPLATVMTFTPEQVKSIRVHEQIADKESLPPTLRALIEIDCGQKLYRELSVIARGQSGNAVQPWKNVPPESTQETLTKLTCG